MNSSDSTSPDLLSLSPEQMRRLGYTAIDALVEYHSRVASMPVINSTDTAEDNPQIISKFQNERQDPDTVLEQVLNDVFTNVMNLMHPRFFAYVPNASNFVSVIGDLLASGFNVFAGTAPVNSGAYEIEQSTIKWLTNLIGFDHQAEGTFVSGGSVASLTALTVARHIKLDNQTDNAVIYCSSQTHSCIDRALFILGFKAEQIRKLEADENFRLNPAELLEEIERDKLAGKLPFCVVGNAGTINTGAVDPLADIASICQKQSLWFHVDAAYGGGALLSRQARPQFNGLELADSVALDPHKWLFQPYECGCVLLKKDGLLKKTFRNVADYLKDTDIETGASNYRDMGIQNTRSFKALKLWLSLHVFGVSAFEQAVDHGLELAKKAENIISQRQCWQVITPATLGVVNFRYQIQKLSQQENDQLNYRIVEELSKSGYAFLSTTILYDMKVIRLCPIHPKASESDIIKTLEIMELIADKLLKHPN